MVDDQKEFLEWSRKKKMKSGRPRRRWRNEIEEAMEARRSHRNPLYKKHR